jgi:ribosomal protein S18 acetylase RimI-like enzyme
VSIVAWLGTVPVGHVLVRWQPDEPLRSALPGIPAIESLWVKPGHESQGIGSRLMDRAEDLARERGYDRVALGVGIENGRARRLYEHRGYREAGIERSRVEWPYLDERGEERTEGETCTYLVRTLTRDDAPESAGEDLTPH